MRWQDELGSGEPLATIALTQVDRDNRLKANNAIKGLRQVTVWVPIDKADDIKALAAQYRKQK